MNPLFRLTNFTLDKVLYGSRCVKVYVTYKEVTGIFIILEEGG